MSRSFDNKIGDRLGQHTATPKPDAKEAIFSRLDSEETSYVWIYHYLASGLLLLSFFMIGRVPDSLPEQNFDPETKESSVAVDAKYEAVVENIDKPTKQESQEDRRTIEQSNVLAVNQQSEEIPNEIIRPAQNANNSAEPKPTLKHYKEFGELNKWKLDDAELPAHIGLIASHQKSTVKSVIPARQRFFNPYFEAGSFFIYNRLRPNLSDDIYIGDFESPYGISISRFGFSAAVGAERQWNKLWTTRLGLLLNNYNQSYSFTVRKTRPDSVVVTDEFLEPVFSRDSVEINKRVTTLGLKFQSIWNLPSEYNSLFVSFEYHHRISKGPSFTYDDTELDLSSRRQYMIELGLRKRLFELKHGDLFVVPGIRYAVDRWEKDRILTVKPFSVGVSLNYTLK